MTSLPSSILWLLLMFWPLSATAQSLQNLLKHISPSPPIEHVQHHALKSNHLHHFEDVRWRMRLSHVVPRLDLSLSWTHDLDKENRYREDLNRIEDGPFQRDFIRQDALQNQDTSRTIRLRARLDLGKLIFDPKEQQWQRAHRQHHVAKQRLLQHVSTLYWARQKHQLHLVLLDKDDIEQIIQHHIQIQLITSQLDGLTNGWFSKSLKKQHSRRRKP